MKKIFVTSKLSLDDLEISPKSVFVAGVTFFPIKHDKVTIEGKNPYFLVAGKAEVTYNGSVSVFPFSIKSSNQSHLKGNLSPTTVIPKESVLVSPQEKVVKYRFYNSNEDLVGFEVSLKLTYVTGSISREIVIDPDERKKMKGNVSVTKFVTDTKDGLSGLNTEAEARWEIYFKSLEPVDSDSDDNSIYHEELKSGSWSPNQTKEVPVTDMAVGVMQPYISEDDGSPEVPVVFTKGWSSETVKMSAKVKSFTEKVKSN